MAPLSNVTLLFVAAILAALIWLIVILKQKKTSANQTATIDAALQTLKSELIEKQVEGLLSLRESLDSANRLLNERLAEGTGVLDRRLELFGEIERKLGQLQVQAKVIEEIGQNIQSLSDLLKPPKLRGNLGEVFLENLLSQILPRALFITQHQFREGQRVDVVIKLGERLLPIDSKFPLEAFQRIHSEIDQGQARRKFFQTLKQHIDTIGSKYIRPDENTTDFALMYIPSEAVYYEFVSLSEEPAFDYSLSRKVIPTSPGHLYAFLASLVAVYVESGLAADTTRLATGLNELAQSLTRISQLHDRMEGSIRSLTLNLTKARDLSGNMSHQLGRLREPAIPTQTKVETEEN